jgi:hypothetical protein
MEYKKPLLQEVEGEFSIEELTPKFNVEPPTYPESMYLHIAMVPNGYGGGKYTKGGTMSEGEMKLLGERIEQAIVPLCKNLANNIVGVLKKYGFALQGKERV